jgi:hypothetical protein
MVPLEYQVVEYKALLGPRIESVARRERGWLVPPSASTVHLSALVLRSWVFTIIETTADSEARDGFAVLCAFPHKRNGATVTFHSHNAHGVENFKS